MVVTEDFALNLLARLLLRTCFDQVWLIWLSLRGRGCGCACVFIAAHLRIIGVFNYS